MTELVAKISVTLVFTASPSDVRRGCAPPAGAHFQKGYALGTGSARKLGAKGRTGGGAQDFLELYGGA